MHPECAWDASMQVQNLAIKAAVRCTWVPCPFLLDGMHWNACETHLKCMQDVSGTCANVTLELSCTVLQYFMIIPNIHSEAWSIQDTESMYVSCENFYALKCGGIHWRCPLKCGYISAHINELEMVWIIMKLIWAFLSMSPRKIR